MRHPERRRATTPVRTQLTDSRCHGHTRHTVSKCQAPAWTQQHRFQSKHHHHQARCVPLPYPPCLSFPICKTGTRIRIRARVEGKVPANLNLRAGAIMTPEGLTKYYCSPGSCWPTHTRLCVHTHPRLSPPPPTSNRPLWGQDQQPE